MSSPSRWLLSALQSEPRPLGSGCRASAYFRGRPALCIRAELGDPGPARTALVGQALPSANSRPETRYSALGMAHYKMLPALVLVALQAALAQSGGASWKGVLRDAAGKPVAAAGVELRGAAVARCRTDGKGVFELREMASGSYALFVEWHGTNWVGSAPVEIRAGARRTESLRLTAEGHVRIDSGTVDAAAATGGEQLSGGQVSALP